MGNGVATAGIEYYLPRFFEGTAPFFDYLGSRPDEATLVLHGDLEPAFQRFWQDTRERYRLVQGAPDRPALPPEALFLSAEEFYTRANAHAQLALKASTADVEGNAYAQKLPDLAVVRGAEEPLLKLKQHLASSPQRVLVLAESEGRRESRLDFLRASSISPPSFDSLEDFLTSPENLGMATAALTEGFASVEAGVDLVTETELFAAAPAQRRRNKKQEQVSDLESLIKDWAELKVADPVVHSAHGIGRYLGLVNMDIGQGPSEFLHLEYADKASLYVPVSQLHQISR
jgi:transcription-repair coupling factor (superfamily II helicase)